MKKIIFFILLINSINSQNLSELTEQNLFRGGNVFLIDKMNSYDLDIDGTPYLNPDFDKGQIIFENGNSYSGEIRIDLVAQNFQIRGKDGKITPIEVNDKVKIKINGDQYKLHAINTTEFGEVGIDQALVINAEEEIFEMANGCICCTVRGDLIRVLGNLMKRRDKFDYVVVETTGLADPGPVAQTFFMDDEISSEFSLDGIITLVDTFHIKTTRLVHFLL